MRVSLYAAFTYVQTKCDKRCIFETAQKEEKRLLLFEEMKRRSAKEYELPLSGMAMMLCAALKRDVY
jgi:hypothetical protein